MPALRHARPAPIARLHGRIAPILLLALSACAPGPYPSLARLPAETVHLPATDGAILAPNPGTADPRLAARLTDCLARAQAGHRAFLARQSETARLVAQAGPPPSADGTVSEDWAMALQAMSAQDSARAPVHAALAQVEEIYTQDRLDHAIVDADAGSATARPDAAAIADVRNSLLAMADSEDSALDALKARMRD